jgi:hypothetical protein
VTEKALSARIQDAFGEPAAREFGDKYLARVVQSSDVIAQSLRRTVILVAGLVVAFLLLAGAETAEFDLGPLKVTSVPSVLTLIPAVVGMLYYDVFLLLSLSHRCRVLRDSLIKTLHPTVFDEDLEVFLGTPTTNPLGGHRWLDIRVTPEGWPARVQVPLRYAFDLVLLFGGLAFLVYAYWHLFDDGDTSTWAVVGSLVVSAVSVVRAVAIMVEEGSNPDDPGIANSEANRRPR